MAASRLRAPKFRALRAFASSVPLSHRQVRRARARRRTICSPERCSARVGVGEGAGARSPQFGVVAMCSSGVGEGAGARGLQSGVVAICFPARFGGGEDAAQLRAAWGATGQFSGIWLGLWVSASGDAAQSASIFILSNQKPNKGVTDERTPH